MVVLVGFKVAVCVGSGVAEGNTVGVVDGNGMLVSRLRLEATVALLDSGLPVANLAASSPIGCPGKQLTSIDNKTIIGMTLYFMLYACKYSVFILNSLLPHCL